MIKHKKTTKEKKNKKNFLEFFKWLIILFSLFFSFSVFYIQELNFVTKSICILILLLISIIISVTTEKGKFIIAFIKAARIEINKIVWPSSKETLYTTLVVFIVTTITSIVLWGLDNILVRFISFITKLGL